MTVDDTMFSKVKRILSFESETDMKIIERKDYLNRLVRLSSLRAIKDAYPKILIANTKHDDYDIEGVKVLDLTKWLMR
ncbi:MAG: hypothetical protein LIV11_10755 [Bacillota bacterium]|nr:hypothetical protein [Bacillota bacterium]